MDKQKTAHKLLLSTDEEAKMMMLFSSTAQLILGTTLWMCSLLALHSSELLNGTTYMPFRRTGVW